MDKPQPAETAPDLVVLKTVIDTLPPEFQLSISGAFKQLNDSLNRKRRIMGMVQSALGQLRLDMKYLVFDLEATRQERDELKKRLGE